MCVITMHFLATAVVRMCRQLWRHFSYVTYPTMFQAIPINTISLQIMYGFWLCVQLKCVINIHFVPLGSLGFQSYTWIPFTFPRSFFTPPTQHFLHSIHSRLNSWRVQLRLGEVLCSVISAKWWERLRKSWMITRNACRRCRSFLGVRLDVGCYVKTVVQTGIFSVPFLR